MDKIGSLWKHKTKDGLNYLSGNAAGGIKVLVYPVKTKKNDKGPDYTLSIEYPGVEQKNKTFKNEDLKTTTEDI